MQIKTIEFRGYRCFSTEWTSLNAVMPINVVIGRNNSGKSQLVDVVASICATRPYRKGIEYRCIGKLDEESLRRRFRDNVSGGELGGDHWNDHGRHLIGHEISWTVDSEARVTSIDAPNADAPSGARSTQARHQLLAQIAQESVHSLTGRTFRRLLADRDIRPEPATNTLALNADGAGATNIIRRYIVSSSPNLPRELIQVELLDALKAIFATDGHFTELQIKVHDETGASHPEGHWEIFLGESKKGLVPLSQSGSGLKTVLLVLLNLLVVPRLENSQKSQYVFAFEELENNLHPALLRRLFQYLADYARREHAIIFLTTHSSVALDYFGLSAESQIIHVTHDGVSARGQIVSAHFDHLGVISELGAKPSDLLQANGIIWVEGPSDCIYLNRWIDLFSEKSLQEGRDYQCAFYGGSLLARTQFTSPEQAEKELVNLFRVNPNIIVVCDGDRSAPGARIKDRVRRINTEVRAIPKSHIWITSAREIENYLPGAVIASALGLTSLPDPGQHELFFPRKGSAAGSSYVESRMQRRSLDKVELAVQSAPHMTKALMAVRFDVAAQMEAIITAIRRWSS